MTLKEFLMKDTSNSSTTIYIYNKKRELIICRTKKYFVDEKLFLNQKVISNGVFSNGDLYIKLDFGKVR